MGNDQKDSVRLKMQPSGTGAWQMKLTAPHLCPTLGTVSRMAHSPAPGFPFRGSSPADLEGTQSLPPPPPHPPHPYGAASSVTQGCY